MEALLSGDTVGDDGTFADTICVAEGVIADVVDVCAMRRITKQQVLAKVYTSSAGGR